MTPRILIIEDDPDIATLLQSTLEQHGYQARVARQGRTGLKLAQSEQPDLILVDLGLPDLPGKEVVLDLRRHTRTPIVVLSALDCPNKKVELLDAGADDYLTKPCRPDELLVRLGVQLRHSMQFDRLTVGALTVSPHEHRVWFGNHELHLSRREEQLLELLARYPGRVFTRDELRERLWAERPCENTTLDTHVTNLRSKLRAAGGSGLIRTVRGVGFGLHPGMTEHSGGR